MRYAVRASDTTQRGYAAPRCETTGVYQVHPLADEGLCQHADGSALRRSVPALENFAPDASRSRARLVKTPGAPVGASVLFPAGAERAAKNRTDEHGGESVLQRWSAQRYASIRCYLVFLRVAR